MSRFDEEPDDDPHGECEAEIKSLKYQLTNYRIAHEQQAATITDLRALSVTHIMLDVVPGFDGCGEEIYAKSVVEVEQCMSKMGIQIDEQAARITRLEAENASDLERQLATITAERDALKVDAERYRWLRHALPHQVSAINHPLDGPKCEHGYPLSAPSCPPCGGRPQASAPAEQPKCKTCGGSGLVNIMTTNEGPDSQFEDVDCPRCDASGIESAAPAETDLDALVALGLALANTLANEEAELLEKLAQAITAMRARLERAFKDCDRAAGYINAGLDRIAQQAARITRLEAENAEARELLRKVQESAGVWNQSLYMQITEFRAKQGD